jgi:XTP/dITP diphosphohydrolase
MVPRRVVVATRNSHKLRELAEILTGIELAPLPAGVDLPPEHGETFAENALAKARAARAARSAGERATDEENLALLLRELDRATDRHVAYVCVMAYVDEAGTEAVFEGRCEGELAPEPRGSGGFGYDPAFVPDDTGPGDQRTMAELSPDEKHAISHRGRAARALAAALEHGVPRGEGRPA